MTGPRTGLAGLRADQVRDALAMANAAPTGAGGRPWRLDRTATEFELHAVTDHSPLDSQELTLACGAALLNLRLAIRSLGVHPDVRLLPMPDRPTLLATVRPQGHRPTGAAEQALITAIPRQHTDRPPGLGTQVPAAVRAELRRAVEVEQAWLAELTEGHLGALRPRDSPSLDPLVVVIGTFQDGQLARLHAGQAIQRALLTATSVGLGTQPIAELVREQGRRAELRSLIGGALWPQAVLRLG